MLPVSEVDQVVDCPSGTHCACGGEVISHGRPWRHQVFELPPIKPIVTEYRCQGGKCKQCRLYQRAPLPPGVPQGQLGPRAIATIATLSSPFQVTQNELKHFLLIYLDYALAWAVYQRLMEQQHRLWSLPLKNSNKRF